MENNIKTIQLAKGQGLISIFTKEKSIIDFLLKTNLDIKNISFSKINIDHIKYIGDQELHQEFLKEFQKESRFIKKSMFVNENTSILINYTECQLKVQKIDSFETKPIIQKSKKRVLIIDDSPTICKILSQIVSMSTELEVMGTANDCFEAREKIKIERPDLITLDINLPKMSGVEFLKSDLKPLGIPVVVVSSLKISDGPLVMEALANGALHYLKKPSLEELRTSSKSIYELFEQLSAKKIQQPKNEQTKTIGKFASQDGVIVIGSSTGGTQALAEILEKLPENIPPIVIVQHIPEIFSKALANRLNTLCKFTVKEVEPSEELLANTVYIAKGGIHIGFVNKRGKIFLEQIDAPVVNLFKPSIDFMMNSLLSINIKPIVGAILTGMGSDGAKGLLALKNKGAFTIAQDEETSIVFGMPKEAIKLNAHKEIIPLSGIADRILEAYNSLYKVQ